MHQRAARPVGIISEPANQFKAAWRQVNAIGVGVALSGGLVDAKTKPLSLCGR
jgi:hypothetical protein